MTPSPNTARIEENLRKVLEETDLTRFENIFIFHLLLTRLEHFNAVSDVELERVGLSKPAIRRLRVTIDKYEREDRISRKPKKYIEVRLESESDAPSDPHHPDSPCLIHRDDIKLLDKIGAGSFGIVKNALWTRANGQALECAIKVLRGAPSEIKNDLQNEIVNMQKLSHPNLIRLYGIVFGADDTTLMVVELCAGGALIDRLIDAERPIPLVTKLIEYARQIAAGMEYLEKMRCVHRDLAARNVLLTKNEDDIKICDFGLSRHLEDNSNYYTMDLSTPKRVPFAWCAPESLRHRQFSHKSDVWSFGVTLWELFTYGEEPWLGYHIGEVLRMVEQGKRMEKPQNSNDELYHIMDLCWRRSPEDRPNFTELRTMLAKINFPLVICHASEMAKKNSDLTVLTGDKIFVVENISTLRSYGQNERTGKFGYFSSAVVRKQTPTTALPDPNKKPRILDIPIQITATPSSGQMRIHEVRDDVKNVQTGFTPKQNLHISHSSSAQQLPRKTSTGPPPIIHNNSAQNLNISSQKLPPRNSNIAPPPIPRREDSFRVHAGQNPPKITTIEAPRKISEPPKIEKNHSRNIPEDDACCKNSSKISTDEKDDGFSQVQLRLAMLLSQAEAKNQSEVIIKPKLPGASKKLEERPETSASSSQLRNPHESMRMAIATAPMENILSRSPEPAFLYDYHQEDYGAPVNATRAQNMNIPGPSSSAAHATAPIASPNNGVVLGFEHYTSNLYPELDSPENRDYNF